MNDFLEAAFPFQRNSRLEFLIILLVGSFVAVFLIIFQPFGTQNFESEVKNLFLSGYGAIVSLVLLFFRFALPRVLAGAFEEDDWTVGKHILWSFLAFAVAITVCYFYWAWFFEHLLTVQLWWEFSRLGMAIAIFPILAIIALDYISLLKIHQREAAAIPVIGSEVPPENVSGSSWEIVGNNEGERLLLRSEQLLFVRAERNYVDVIYDGQGPEERKEDVGVREAVFRLSLKELESQLSAPGLLRCHRSYLVNLDRVTAIRGNAQGYQLFLPPSEDLVPVSRSRAKATLAALRERLQ